MTTCVEIRCPLCGKRRLQPAERATSDVLVEVLSAHLLDNHPAVDPTAAEGTIEEALETIEPIVATDEKAVNRWVDPDA